MSKILSNSEADDLFLMRVPSTSACKPVIIIRIASASPIFAMILYQSVLNEHYIYPWLRFDINQANYKDS